MKLIDKDALVAEIKTLLAFYLKEIENSKEDPWAMDIAKRDILQEILSFIDSLQEEPVSIWHDAGEEPNDKSSCLIHYIVGGEVSYRDIFPVLYNKKAREFVSESYPHPTEYKVEQSSLEGGVVAEVYKNMRDRFPLSDIYKWAYIDDILNLSNVQRTIKNWKEPVSEDLGEYINELSKQFPEVSFAKLSRIAVRVAQWQKEQFEKNRLTACDKQTKEEAEREQDFVMGIIENAHRQPTFDDAIKYGMRFHKKQMMVEAINGTARPDDNEIWCNLASSNLKDGDKVKVIIIKED